MSLNANRCSSYEGIVINMSSGSNDDEDDLSDTSQDVETGPTLTIMRPSVSTENKALHPSPNMHKTPIFGFSDFFSFFNSKSKNYKLFD